MTPIATIREKKKCLLIGFNQDLVFMAQFCTEAKAEFTASSAEGIIDQST